jgi:hypothetical protein
MFYPNSPFGTRTNMMNTVGRLSMAIDPAFTIVPPVDKVTPWLSLSGSLSNLWYKMVLPFVFKYLLLSVISNYDAFCGDRLGLYWRQPESYPISQTIDTTNVQVSTGIQGRSYFCMHLWKQDLELPYNIVDHGGKLGFWIDCDTTLDLMDNNGTNLDCVIFRFGRYHAHIEENTLVLTSSIGCAIDVFNRVTGLTHIGTPKGPIFTRMLVRVQDCLVWATLVVARRIESDNRDYMFWPRDTPLTDGTDGNMESVSLIEAWYPFVDEPTLTWSTSLAIYDLFQDTMNNNRWASKITSLYMPMW